MQKQNRLGPNRQFQYVYHRGKRLASRSFTLLYVKGRPKKVGFSVSKKIGNAVTRNLVKRRLRECIRHRLPGMKNGLYVFIAKPGVADLSFQELSESVTHLLNKLNENRQ